MGTYVKDLFWNDFVSNMVISIKYKINWNVLENAEMRMCDSESLFCTEFKAVFRSSLTGHTTSTPFYIIK